MTPQQEEIQQAVETIQNALRDFTGGWNNPEPKRIIDEQLWEIRARIQHATLEVKNLRTRLDEFYSPRKWQRWGTVDNARVEVLKALASLSTAALRTQ